MGILQGAVLVFGVLTQLCDGQALCEKTTTSGGVTRTKYTKCSDRCCGDVNDEYCCESSNSGLIIGIVATSVVFIILLIGLAICCMKNHSKQTTRVHVLQIVESQHAAARRDERRERRQREAGAAMAGYPQQYMAAGYPAPPSYNSMYGADLPPGAYGGPSHPTAPMQMYPAQAGSSEMGEMDSYPTKT